ncbi:MAG: DUF58 domain-containing protein [Propionibacteriaceae bacterium]|jgi:uncharacterized protein (DUF58 family)|nr:DUF58 domain-containing protein [Propionibacteriaceae bacterium]
MAAGARFGKAAQALRLARPPQGKTWDWIRAFTPFGWGALVGALIAAWAGWGAGWVEARAIAAAFALAFLAAVLSVLGRSRFAVDIVLPSERTVVGKAAVGEIRVRGVGLRASAGVIELPVTSASGTALAQFVVPALASGEEWRELFAVPARRRSVVEVGPPRSVRSDALGLLRKTKLWSAKQTLYVNPLTIFVPFDATGFQLDIEGVTTAMLSSSDVSFHALRDYQPGDDQRFVHWPSSAKHGHLIVRQFEETRRSHHLVALNTGLASWDAERFEIGVSIAASLARAGMGYGKTVSLITSDAWISTASPAQMLDELTAVTRKDSPPLISQVGEALAAKPSTSVLTIVTGEEDEFGLSRFSTLAGPDVATTVIRVRDAPGARHTFGNTRILDVPSLDELPRLLSRAERV